MKALIILVSLNELLCCRSQGGGDKEGGGEEGGRGPNDTQFLGNLSGWGAPDIGDHKNWKDFLVYYKNVSMQNGPDDSNWKHFFSQSKNDGFPKEWLGYGPGSPGNVPPDWAKIPGNYGRPDFCFQFPAVGTCSSNLIRWAFNPQTQICQMFYYSGCGANENNFQYKASCEEACTKAPVSPCEPQEKVEFMDLLDGYG